MTTTLFDAFAPSDATAWKEKIIKELKGTDYQSIHKLLYEDITLKPFYTAEDLPANSQGNLKKSISWANCVPVIFTSAQMAEAQTQVQEGIKKGAEGIWLNCSQITPELIDFNTFFADIPLQNISLIWQFDQNLAQWLEKITSLQPEKNIVSYEIDKTQWADRNVWQNWKNNIEKYQQQVDVWLINAQIWGNAGSNATQELAFCLTQGIEYLNQLSEVGLNLTTFAPKIGFSLNVGNHFFVEIAKFEAFRLLWANVLEAFQLPTSTETYLHAQNILWNKTQTDAYNNILRTTTEAVSAVLGGCNSITVLPYNVAQTTEYEEFAHRIARNISIILKEEAHLDKTIDATKGTYFIENLKINVAEKAWQMLQTIEQQGGFNTAYQTGFMAQSIENIQQKRIQDFNNQQLVLVGLNKYPNPQDKPSVVELQFQPLP